MAQGGKEHFRRDPARAADRERLGERAADLEQHHVVHQLRDLAAADRAAMQDVGGKAAEVWPDARESGGIGPDHDAELAALGGVAGARDRGVGVGDADGRKAGRELAGERYRRGREIDQRAPLPHHAKEALRDGSELRPARQRQEDDRRPACCVLDRGGHRETVPGEPLRRRWPEVEAAHPTSGFLHQMGADRLAHDPEPDAGQCLPASPPPPP